MQIPLSEVEIKLIQTASTNINMAYNSLFNALVALCGVEEMTAIRIKLASLNETANTLRNIRHVVQDNPKLTDDQLEDISVIRLTAGNEFLDAQGLLTAKAAAALDIQPTRVSNIPALRHEVIGLIGHATKSLEKLYEMVDSKSKVFSRINNDQAPGRRP